ncbi:MAG: hypothetical protein Q8K65_06380 [Alphaproteobacteria bacterium]|nr:hypothetical protein [Alphaproteobacteria bacterium]
MSFRKSFNDKARAASKKMRVMTASIVLAFSAAGGAYIGHDVAQSETQPQVSQFTLMQASQFQEGEMSLRDFYKGRLPADAAPDLIQPHHIDEFTARIDTMERLAQRHTAAKKINPDEAAVLQAVLTDEAVSFVNDLRMSHNISEQNYSHLIADYQMRVGFDVSDRTGNYTRGIQYLQESQLSTVFGAIFGDDLTDEEMSREVGDMMAEGAKEYAQAGLIGGAAGGLGTGLLLLPALLFTRRRDPHIKLPLKP